MNKLDNTVIILSSDHGESFEHRYQGHGGSHLYEQATHIPLIIKETGHTDGRIVSDLVEQIDIPATIIDLAHISIPKWMEGRSLIPLMRGISLPSKPIFSMSLGANSQGHQITKGTIAVWEGDYKLIHYLKENKSLIFNLKQDPNEINNLFDKESEVGKRLLTVIQDNLKMANERISSGE
jgi:arylsulfatase A-like enzyme